MTSGGIYRDRVLSDELKFIEEGSGWTCEKGPKARAMISWQGSLAESASLRGFKHRDLFELISANFVG